MEISFFLFFFVISSSCCRRRRLFPSGNKRHFIVAGAPGVGLKKVTRSRWREPKKPLEMKARPSSLSSGVCVRACRFHLLFKYPFSSLLFSKQNIPPNGRRRPSHHPRLYNVIRVYICSIQTCHLQFLLLLKEKLPSGDVIKTDKRFSSFCGPPYFLSLKNSERRRILT